MLTKKRKNEIVKEYGRVNNDTGSAEVQIALITERISYLTEHFQQQPKDFSSRQAFYEIRYL